MDPFLTTYKADYVRKPRCKREPNGVHVEFRDPINISFKNYLQLGGTEPAPEPPKEDADNYLQKHGEEYPKHIEIFYKTPLNNSILEESFRDDGRTIYQLHYCEPDDGKTKSSENVRYSLPGNWEIAETTHRYWYRRPVDINPRAIMRIRKILPTNNLDPNENTRAILKVTTGDTEYSSKIGALGLSVMDDELLGKVEHAP